MNYKKIIQSPRLHRGFTLIELMIVVAIIAIIAAVAVPALNGFNAKTQMVRVDNYAKQIYQVAQNRMVSTRNTGVLAKNIDGSNSVNLLVPKPGDPTSKDSYNFLFLSNDINVPYFPTVLPPGSVAPEVFNGHYLVTFERYSGTIQGVYFSEKDAIDPGQLQKLMDEPRERQQQKIGYYGGDNEGSPTLNRQPTPKLTMVNGEKLQVELTIGNVSNDSTVELTVANADNPAQFHTWNLSTGSFDGATANPDGTTTITKILDEEVVGGNDSRTFRTLCPNITPGANIRVCARLLAKFRNEGSTISAGGGAANIGVPSYYAVGYSNSLFESVTVLEETVAGVNSKEVCVSTKRHLYNFANLTKNERAPSGARLYLPFEQVGALHVIQTKDIDLAASSGAYQNFSAIDSLFIRSYNGKGNEVQGLRMIHTTETTPVGLFSNNFCAMIRTKDPNISAVIEQVNIVDPTISVTRESDVGALIGLADKIEIRDCHVYLSPAGRLNPALYTISGEGIVGGLVGKAIASPITGCSVSLSEIYNKGDVPGASLGGLVGNATGVRGSNAGTISYSYANVTNLKGKAKYGGCGMLVGGISGGKGQVKYCYGVGNIAVESEYIAGLVGGWQAVKTPNLSSYSLVTFTGSSARNKIYAIAGEWAGPLAVNSSYVIDHSVGALPGSAIGFPTLSDFSNTTPPGGASSWSKISGGTTHPYARSVGAYPYWVPMQALGENGRTDFYGDWPAP